MDDFGGGLKDDDEEGREAAKWLLIGLAHIGGIGLVVYLFAKCVSSKAPTLADGEPLAAEPEQMQPKKQLFSAYVLLFSGGLVGAHHFYLERLVHGLMACYSGNFFLLGWILDLFLLPVYVRGFNSRRTDASAPVDSSRRQLLCKLPFLTCSMVSFIVAVGLFLPWALHRSGVVDIDRLAAQTELNPYDVLEIPHTAGIAEAKSAYRKLSLKWHPDRNTGCGKECDHKMSEITKSFDLIKHRRAPAPESKTWQSWLEDIGRDWWYVLETASEKWNKEDKQKAASSSKKSKGAKSNSEL